MRLANVVLLLSLVLVIGKCPSGADVARLEKICEDDGGHFLTTTCDCEFAAHTLDDLDHDETLDQADAACPDGRAVEEAAEQCQAKKADGKPRHFVPVTCGCHEIAEEQEQWSSVPIEGLVYICDDYVFFPDWCGDEDAAGVTACQGCPQQCAGSEKCDIPELCPLYGPLNCPCGLVPGTDGMGCPMDSCALEPLPCTAEYAPVCGSDGVTYSNDCLANNENCEHVEFAYSSGVCEPVCPEAMCTLACESGFVKDENGCDTCTCTGDVSNDWRSVEISWHVYTCIDYVLHPIWCTDHSEDLVPACEACPACFDSPACSTDAELVEPEPEPAVWISLPIAGYQFECWQYPMFKQFCKDEGEDGRHACEACPAECSDSAVCAKPEEPAEPAWVSMPVLGSQYECWQYKAFPQFCTDEGADGRQACEACEECEEEPTCKPWASVPIGEHSYPCEFYIGFPNFCKDKGENGETACQACPGCVGADVCDGALSGYTGIWRSFYSDEEGQWTCAQYKDNPDFCDDVGSDRSGEASACEGCQDECGGSAKCV